MAQSKNKCKVQIYLSTKDQILRSSKKKKKYTQMVARDTATSTDNERSEQQRTICDTQQKTISRHGKYVNKDPTSRRPDHKSRYTEHPTNAEVIVVPLLKSTAVVVVDIIARPSRMPHNLNC